MPSTVYYLEQSNFRSQIDAAQDVILRVSEGVETNMPTSVVEYFDQEYPGAFQYLTIRRELVTIQEWWNKNFTNGYSTMPRMKKAGIAGYYLFIRGVPVEWTSGYDNDAAVENVGDLVSLLMFKDNPVALQNLQADRDKRKGKVATEKFERYFQFNKDDLRYIQGKVAKHRAAEKAKPEEERFKMPGAEEPPKKKSSPPPDDYALIGSTSTATNEELRRAYHEKVKQNAPDKLAQMDPELQEIATERMKKINGAWGRIKDARKIK